MPSKEMLAFLRTPHKLGEAKYVDRAVAVGGGEMAPVAGESDGVDRAGELPLLQAFAGRHFPNYRATFITHCNG